MAGFRWTAAICCEAGSVLQKNEDNFYLNGVYKTIDQANQDFFKETAFKSKGLFAVFDGIGGESYGELASTIAASLLCEYAKKILAQKQKYIPQFFHEANRRICLEAKKRHVNIGTTLVMAAIIKKQLLVYNLGDSRAYLLQGDDLICLTKDHTTPPRTINRTSIAAFPYQRSHRLSQYLGIPEDEFIIEPHNAGMELLAGDKILLCSDGITDMLNSDMIKSILLMSIDPGDMARKLVDISIAEGGKDNTTALILSCY
jgi:serine/threonine protein phosphatase PrpC